MQFDQLKRRESITLLAAAATFPASWPIAAKAQPRARTPTIGFLGSGTPSSDGAFATAFVRGLRELGWLKAATLRLNTDGARLALIDLLSLQPSSRSSRWMSFSHTEPRRLLRQNRQRRSFQSYSHWSDPVEVGLAASLARPGSNITGVSNQSSDLGGKRLELLRDVLPGVRRIAMMVDVGNPGAMLDAGQARTVAHTLGFEIAMLEIRRTEDVVPGFERSVDECTHLLSLQRPHIHQPLSHQHLGARRAATHYVRLS